jgi:hypothetical protein
LAWFRGYSLESNPGGIGHSCPPWRARTPSGQECRRSRR